MDAWEMADAERTAFADLTDQLTPEQWDKPSLCTAWKVRDVVAHVTDGADLSLGKSLGTLAKYGFNMKKMIEREAQKGGARSTDELRKGLRGTVGMRKALGAKPPDMVMETIVHQQDVRRPLGIARAYPPEEMKVALDRAAGMGNALLPGKKRAAGLHLKATDLDWERGAGDDVSGPAEALLLAMAGRPVALADLSGPGAETLKQRITS